MDAEKSAVTAEATSQHSNVDSVDTPTLSDPALAPSISNNEVAKVMSTAHRLLIVGSVGIVIFIGSLVSIDVPSNLAKRELTVAMPGFFHCVDLEPNAGR